MYFDDFEDYGSEDAMDEGLYEDDPNDYSSEGTNNHSKDDPDAMNCEDDIPSSSYTDQSEDELDSRTDIEWRQPLEWQPCTRRRRATLGIDDPSEKKIDNANDLISMMGPFHWFADDTCLHSKLATTSYHYASVVYATRYGDIQFPDVEDLIDEAKLRREQAAIQLRKATNKRKHRGKKPRAKKNRP